MKIAIYSTMIYSTNPDLDTYGGLELIAGLQAKHFIEQGHEVSLFACDNSYFSKEEDGTRPPELEKGHLYSAGPKGTDPTKAWKAYWDTPMTKQVLKEADIVCNHSWNYYPYAAYNEIKHLCSVWHGPYPDMKNKPPYPKPNLIGVSFSHAQHLQKHSPEGVTWRAVQNGIPLYKYDLNRKSIAERERLLWLSRIYPPKGCILEGNHVFSSDGLKDISLIKKDEQVLGHDGKYHNVTETFKRKYEGTIIEIWPRSLPNPICLTPEHPIYVYKARKCKGKNTCRPSLNAICNIRFKNKLCNDKYKYEPEWIRADEITNSDFLIFPPPNLKTSNIVDIRNQKTTKSFKEINGKIHIQVRKSQLDSKQSIDALFKLDEEFLRFCGLYISEGHTEKNRFCISSSDFNLLNKYIHYLQNELKFNNKLTIRENNRNLGNTTYVLVGNSSTFSEIFKYWFGKNSGNKRFPSWFFGLEKKFTDALLQGMWRGDGTITIDKHGNSVYRYATISKSLAFQLWALLHSKGIISCISKIRYSKTAISRITKNKRKKNKKYIYEISIRGKDNCHKMHNVLKNLNPINKRQRNRQDIFQFKGHIWLPIREIRKKQFEGNVYNLEVQNCNSYVCDGITVHNCHRAIEIANSLKMPIDLVGGSYGDIPQYTAHIKKMCEDSKYATFHGEVSFEKKKEFYRNAKCLIVPIDEKSVTLSNGQPFVWNEPFGLLTPEANACGTPVIVTPNGGLTETMVHGYNGFFANTNKEFEYFISRIDEIKPENCRKIAELFDYKIMGNHYLKLFEEIIAGNGW